MIQKNGRSLIQNRVFGWVAHYCRGMLGSTMEIELCELFCGADGYGRSRPAPSRNDARAQRTEYYMRAAHILQKYQIERNAEAALRDLQSMLRKACKYFNCDDLAMYEAVCENRIKIPRHGAVKLIAPNMQARTKPDVLPKHERA